MFWPSSLGTTLEQNLEIPMTLTPIPDINTSVSYADTRPKRKTVAVLPSQWQPQMSQHPRGIPMTCP